MPISALVNYCKKLKLWDPVVNDKKDYIKTIDRYTGALLGLAIGDALGAPVEFKARGSFPPVTGYQTGGPFNLPKGYWTDDTSMALCLATSLLRCKGFDPEDQLHRYTCWYRDGYFSSTGTCFDIGNATRAALHRFETTDEHFCGNTSPDAAGNGAIMRLAPIALAYAKNTKKLRLFARESARTTHASLECLESAEILAVILQRALLGESKEQVLKPVSGKFSPALALINQGSYKHKDSSEIKGSGYTVESLEAALWAIYNGKSFSESVLLAVNLGDDTDTTGAVTGQIAGALYGQNIPVDWLEGLYKESFIREIATLLSNCNFEY